MNKETSAMIGGAILTAIGIGLLVAALFGPINEEGAAAIGCAGGIFSLIGCCMISVQSA